MGMISNREKTQNVHQNSVHGNFTIPSSATNLCCCWWPMRLGLKLLPKKKKGRIRETTDER